MHQKCLDESFDGHFVQQNVFARFFQHRTNQELAVVK